MHISIGAAILIIGLLFLATSPAGRAVLGVAFVLIIVFVGGCFVYVEQQEKERPAREAAERTASCSEPLTGHDSRYDRAQKKLNCKGADLLAFETQLHSFCENFWSNDLIINDVEKRLREQMKKDCEEGR
jgi:hypothetical protein